MALTFKDLKNNSKKQTEKLVQQLEKLNKGSGNFQQDTRFWQPEVDGAGNGYAVIRFLPAHKTEEIPFVRVFEHSFKGPTGVWYIENSLTTIGKPDPVTEYNNKLWNSGNDEDKKLAQKYKRQLRFISNILVVQDKKHPENEGKVFLYKYGKKIYDKINALLSPEFEDEESINPFDFWSGCNFKLKIRNVDGYRNYDKCEFEKPEPISEDDAEIEKIWDKVVPLGEFLDEKNFKTYDELKERHRKALGLIGTKEESDSNPFVGDDEQEQIDTKAKKQAERRAKEDAAEEERQAAKETESDDEDEVDESIELFSSLADDD